MGPAHLPYNSVGHSHCLVCRTVDTHSEHPGNMVCAKCDQENLIELAEDILYGGLICGDYSIKNWRTHPVMQVRMRKSAWDNKQCIVCGLPHETSLSPASFTTHPYCQFCGEISGWIFDIATGRGTSGAPQKANPHGRIFDSSDFFTWEPLEHHIMKYNLKVISYSIIAPPNTAPKQKPDCVQCWHWSLLNGYCTEGCAGASEACFKPA